MGLKLIKPSSPDLPVPYPPPSTELLVDEAWVEWEHFWLRRLNYGEIVVVKEQPDPVAPEKEPPAPPSLPAKGAAK